MERGNSGTIRAGAFLVLASLLFVGLWLVAPQEFSAADPLAYSQRAFALAHDSSFGVGDVFDHRLAITVPVAILYSLFGVSIVTTNLWPLAASLVVVVVVWTALPDPRSRVAGAVICVTSVPLFLASRTLFPDLVAAAFMASSSVVLFHRATFVRSRAAGLFASLAAVTLLFLAFLAKESAYWVLPLWALALARDLRHEDRAVRLRRFYAPALGAAVVLGVLYLGFCRVTWGDPLSRLKTVQALTGHHLWSWSRASAGELAKRLTISPARLLIGQYGVPMLLLALWGFATAPPAVRPWRHYCVGCLLFFWFGSTSFTSYEPLPLVDRMTLPLLPGLYVLAATAAARLTLPFLRARGLHSLLPALLVLGVAGWPFARTVESLRRKAPPEAAAMSIVKETVRDHPDRDYLLVCSDERSSEVLAFYFGYRYPRNLRVLPASHLAAEPLERGESFVFLDRARSRFLRDEYRARTYDDAIDSLGLVPVYASVEVALLRTERRDQLRGLIASGPRDTSRAP